MARVMTATIERKSFQEVANLFRMTAAPTIAA
jgi:hypothetical protein